jgi:hypothetical protein
VTDIPYHGTRFDLPWWRSYRERLDRLLRQQTIVMRAEPVQLL